MAPAYVIMEESEREKVKMWHLPTQQLRESCRQAVT
jgi:hypothetical protein